MTDTVFAKPIATVKSLIYLIPELKASAIS
jgi:hypothetical protein